jgi:hypothetical protein
VVCLVVFGQSWTIVDENGLEITLDQQYCLWYC